MKKLPIKIKIAIISGIFILMGAFVGSPLLPYLSEKIFFKKLTSNTSSPENKANRSLAPIRIYFESSSQKINDVVFHLRSSNKIRKLNSLETGRSISYTSYNTYFFVHASNIQISGDLKTCLDKSIVKSSRQSESDFEIHYLTEKDIMILVYVSDDTGALLSKANSNNEKPIIVSPSPWGGFKNLALIPLDRIVKSSDREIVFDNNKTIHILDTVLH